MDAYVCEGTIVISKKLSLASRGNMQPIALLECNFLTIDNGIPTTREDAIQFFIVLVCMNEWYRFTC